MRNKAPVFLLMTVVGLFFVPTATRAQWLGNGHARYGHPANCTCKVCVPELVKKTRVVYDYICVPFCVRMCSGCCQKLKLHGGRHGHGCDCGHCRHSYTQCPDCVVRYKKVLVKRFVDDGCEWQCKLQKGCHGDAPQPGADVIPIPPPVGKGPFMPPAKNGEKRLSVPSPYVTPTVTAPAPQLPPSAPIPTTFAPVVPQRTISIIPEAQPELPEAPTTQHPFSPENQIPPNSFVPPSAPDRNPVP